MSEEISMEQMTSEYYDVLKEIGNIGAGNATTALGTDAELQGRYVGTTGKTYRI
jgi:chemotaxis protein CheC